MQAQYCDGVNAACGLNGGAANDPSSFERRGQFLDGLQRRFDVDAYATNRGGSLTNYDFDSTKVWSVEAQLRHYWTPLLRSNLMASYIDIDVPNQVHRIVGVGDASSWDVAANLIWGQSRRTAEIGVEVVYKQLDQDVHRLTQDGSEQVGRRHQPVGLGRGRLHPAQLVITS